MYNINDSLMQEIVRLIVRQSNPQRVILFGSRARGNARPESDLDLLVVTEDARPRAARASELYGVLSDIPIPLDILVYQPDEIAEWSNVPQAFATTTVREGMLLYKPERALPVPVILAEPTDACFGSNCGRIDCAFIHNVVHKV